MSTILVYAPAAAHTKTGHPESHDRLANLMPMLNKYGVLADLTQLHPVLASQEQLERAHSRALIEQIRQVSLWGGGLLDHGDTYATAESYDLARLAAGGACAAVDHILTGQARNGMALVRPPGHHAEYDRVSGFCLFNNVAVAARHAQAAHGLQRVMILDFDVHHGNGTQDIFYRDHSVLFISTHLFMPYHFYPGTGSLQEVGRDIGEGYTLNVPLPPRVGDVGYGRIFQEVVYPRALVFQPELILISAGFDAHWQDPLAMAGLSLTGYAQLSRSLVEMAEQLCNGRILFVLEGGYQHTALHYGILNTLYSLLGQDKIHDPLGPMPRAEHDVTDLLHQLKHRHLRN